MATATRPTEPPSRSSALRVVFISFFVLLILVMTMAGVGAYWFHTAAMQSQPRLDGTLRLNGLNAPVSVIYDARAVPNITALSMEDLFFAQGYVTAQERLWSMDMYRRYAAGELSGALGANYVKRDIYQRTLGLRQVAEQAAANLSPRDRSYMEAYARGVNAYIADHQHNLPLEFRVLRYRPNAWTVEDSFLVGASLSEALNHGYYKAKLEREKILTRLGPELTNDLYVNTSFRDVPPGTDQQEIRGDDPTPGEEEQPRSSPRKDQMLRGIARWPQHEAEEILASLSGSPLRPGSNNWVLSGAHTVSGKPLLANDMHLGHRMPNTWYEAHLTCGDYDVVGVTLPGLPAVIVGHNQHIAWGITNVGADVEDIYIETFNDKGQYLTPSGWQEPEHRKETIHVLRGGDIPLDVIVTRHGPIITGLLKHETRMLALHSVDWDPKYPMTYPFFDINMSHNWDEFNTALAKFTAPSENFVYADVDGHIGYHATGVIPIRANGDGSLPVNGSDDAHEWTGAIPYDKLPSAYDPPSGVIATANSRITPDGYPYSIATEWVAPYRTERIYHVLHEDKKFSPSDMLALQTDVYSAFDRFLAQRFAYAVDHASHPSERARKAADLLRDFDGRMEIHSPAAAIVRVARGKLEKILLESTLGPEDAKLYNWFMSEVWLENTVLLQPPRWLPAQYPDYNNLLAAAVEQAVTDKRAPHDLSKWNYGKTFPVQSSHDLFGKIPFINRWAGPGVLPQSGDGTTVKQVGRDFGPSERLTVDFSNFDNSTLNIVNGQSGHIFNPHFNDQWNAWYHGTTFPLPYSVDAVRKALVHELKLLPKN
jgi:penicillin amidase